MARELVLGGAPPTIQETRLSAQDINSAPTIFNSGQRISGDGATIPLVYGRAPVQGLLFAEAEYAGALYSGVIWCLGEIYQIESVFINDEAPPAGVEVRHYRGTTLQGIDPWLAGAISGYDDTLVISDRGSSIGVAYSVFKIPSGTLSGVPYFKAIIQGKLINDPNAASNTDPYFSLNGIDVDFTTGGTDSSDNSHTITLGGGATIDSSGLLLADASPVEYATVTDHASLEAGTSINTFEVVATSDTIGAGTAILLTHGVNSSPLGYSIQIVRSTASLLLYLSSNGSTWDIANGETIGTITTAKFYATIERIGDEIVTYLDGEEGARVAISPTSPIGTVSLFDSGEDWYISDPTGTSPWEGSVQAWRYCIGANRYGSEHTATATPFADSDSYGAQTVYSVNPALMWADMASNSLYGLGATTENEDYAAEYTEELLDETCGSPLITRAETGIVISSNRRVEYWLDILAMYANCIWYPWGSNLRIQPDERVTAANPSGLDVVSDGTFDAPTSPSAWTLGDGWAIGAGVVTIDGSHSAESILSQTLTTDANAEYSVSVTVSSYTSGSISVDLGGTEVIASQSAAGTFTGVITVGGTSNDLEIKAAITSPNTVLTISELYVKRSYYKATKWLPGSMELVGPSERGTPTSVKVNYTVPDDDSPNWVTASTVFTSPYAESGEVPFIQTVLDLPGVQRIGEANNKAVQRVQRMHDRWEMSYTTKSDGLLHRKGDTVQPTNTYRGVSGPVWVETVEMTEPGLFEISGLRYANIHFPDYCELNLCEVNLPTSGTVEAEEIYTEDTETITNSYRYGIMGVHGDIIIANPGDRKIVYSADGGESWTTTTNSLPVDPDDAGDYLEPSSWQYYQGRWYCHLRQGDGGNTTSYIGSTVDGSSWTLGDAFHNGRYTQRSIYIVGDRMITGGRRPNNDMVWEGWDDLYAGTSVSSDILVGGSNQNHYGLLRLSTGFAAMRRTSGGDMKIDYITYNETTELLTSRSTFTGSWINGIEYDYISNNDDTVLITAPNETDVYQWQDGFSSLATVLTPSTGISRLGWNDHHWLDVAFSAGTSTIQAYHCLEADGGSNWVTGAKISLPSNQNSTNDHLCNIHYAKDGYWIGWYRKAGTNFYTFIKFQYGDVC